MPLNNPMPFRFQLDGPAVRAMTTIFLAVLALAAGLVWQSAQAQQRIFTYPTHRDLRGTVPPGPRLLPSPPLGAGPWVFHTTEADIKVSVVARGISHPYAFAFLPDGDILVTERAGKLRLIHDGALDPKPVEGLPKVIYRGTEAGLMDLALDPQFAQNHYVYFAYHKPIGYDLASSAIGRGTWDGKALTDVHDIFISDDVDTEVSRLAFGPDGTLYMSIGGPGEGPEESVMRAQHPHDYAGKIIRLNADGSLPQDNPFLSKRFTKPYIFALGFRNVLGLTVNPWTHEIWATEIGPNGGDELNIIRAGKNYGWPIVSYGSDYFGKRFPSDHAAHGFEEPIWFWTPPITPSGAVFYTGDKFPKWKRSLFVGGLREGEFSPTGQLKRLEFNDKWQVLREEALLRPLHQRVRDVRQGPDGNLYVLTEESDSALLKIEPAEESVSSAR
ncbi:MAG TPA: PQQ-dependent sugar dehydrogenase [Gammaproteobacteria bacterium]|nr:PQQ-dependent sugar dehydrogenase [Gammaproteobacteria bacterium]